MTKLLDKAIEAVRVLTPQEQNEIARAMLALAQRGDKDDGEEVEEIDPDHLEAIDRGIAQADRREFATDEQILAVFRHRRG